MSDTNSLFDVVAEKAWADLAALHREAGEVEACKQAAEIADRVRFFRLHRESLRFARELSE